MSGPLWEGNGDDFLKENDQKDLQSLGTSLDIRKDDLHRAPFSQRPARKETCSEGDFVGGLPALQTDDSSTESNEDEKRENQDEELSADKKTVQVHERVVDPIFDDLVKDHELSNGISADGMALQEHSNEGNMRSCVFTGDDNLMTDQMAVQEHGTEHKTSDELVEDDNVEDMGGTTNACHSPILSSENCTCEVTASQKIEYHLASVSTSSNDIICCKPELAKDMDGSVSNSPIVESHGSSRSEAGKLGEDEEDNTGAEHPVRNLPEGVSEQAHSVSTNAVVNSNISPSSIGYDEKNGFYIDNSSSLIASVEPEVVKDQVVDHKATYETPCLDLQELGLVSCKGSGKDVDGASITLADNSQVANAGKTSEPMSRNNLLANNRNASAYECLKDFDEDADGGDFIASGKVGCNVEPANIVSQEVKGNDLEQENLTDGDQDANGGDCIARENIVIPVEHSKVTSEGGIRDDDGKCGEEDYASPEAEMSLSDCSFTMSKARIMDEDTLSGYCSVDHTDARTYVEGKPLSQSRDGAASTECRHSGCIVEKDGGSSLDSTAGTGLLQSDGYEPVEDEENSSTGCEDTTSSLASIQPLTQQRKKINIHHQFVREIVKIQHDREQYDREQAGRQIQAQQAAGLSQVGRPSSAIKEQKSSSSQLKDIRNETNEQKVVKDLAIYRQVKDSQQKQPTRNKKSPLIQSRNAYSHHWNSPFKSNEQSQQALLQSMGAKEGKAGWGKQQHSMSIYRPPVARESFATEQRNLGEPETFYNQSGAYAINSSPGSSTESFSESHVPIVGSPLLVNEEGSLKAVKSSEECYADSLESEADDSSPGIGIKVTFDIEKKQRHIHLLDGPHSLSKGEPASLVASCSTSGSKASKGPKFTPSFNNLFQDPKASPGNRQLDHSETTSKGNDCHFMQVKSSGSSQTYSSAQPSQYHRRVGKSLDKVTGKKCSFFEQADNGANLHTSSSWLQKSPRSFLNHGSDGRSGRNMSNDGLRQPEWMPNPSLRGSSTSSSQRTASLGSSNKGDPISFEESSRTAMNMRANFQQRQLNTPRPHESRGNLRHALSNDISRGKKDSQHRSSKKDFGSPFQAMKKDVSKQQTVLLSPAQRSANANLDSKGFGMSWQAKDQAQTLSRETSQESVRRSQSEASRKVWTQNVQAQSTALPSRESLFPPMPMQEKWGDIVDDLTDSYDYLQIKSESERETHSSRLSYGGSNQSSVALPDAGSLKKVSQDSKQDRRTKYSYKETDNLQKHTDTVRERSAYEMPARKSVFERLGRKNNFQESILGPPPKILDNRGVLKASPDTIVSNPLPIGTYNSFDTGFYGSQWPPQVPSVQHGNSDNIINEGREVVVQAYTEVKQRRSKRELYVPRRGS